MTFFAITAKCRASIVQPPLKYYIILSMRISLILLAITVISSSLLFATHVNGQQIENVNVNVELKSERLVDVFKKIEQKTPFTFLYRNEEVSQITGLKLGKQQLSVSALLEKVLQGTKLRFKQSGRRIVITSAPSSAAIPAANTELKPILTAVDDSTMYIITGKVLEAKSGLPIPGANVVSKYGRTATNAKGVFSLMTRKGAVLRISSIGFEVAEFTVKGTDEIFVSLKESEQVMKDVIVYGLFTRKAESSTGATASFSGAELKKVGNINVLQSLAILDPSFKLLDNLNFGSDPNRLPEVVLRGESGIPDVSLNAKYANAPNLPLFILDGFETTIQRVYDLNMNMVASITLLKDASAKAIYGSKAGNGVVVIETVRPAAGDLRISYTGSLDVSAPDLSSYHLTNSMDKLQAEVLAGKYTSTYPELQYPLTQQYSANLEQALGGVNTYWLAKPLQNGYGQKHNIYLDGGTEAMRYSAGINSNQLRGVMMGSERNTVSGVINLQYRKNAVTFRNNLTIDRNKTKNSPYGKFGDYAKMNPYWKTEDENGNMIPYYTVLTSQVYSPLYNASLNSKDQTEYTNITENFYGEWEAKKNLRFTARVGITTQNNGSDYFITANHTNFINIPTTSPEYLNRGQYTVTNGKSSNVSSDLGAAYSFTFGKSQVFSNLIYSIQQMSSSMNGMTMVGYPNDRLDQISLGSGYQPGSRAAGLESTDRNTGVVAAVNYSYDNRFLADLSLRGSGSSQFGANNRWGLFWATGLGWNLHNEKWMKNVSFINSLKIRGSVGTSGTQNFSSYQSISSYSYITDQTYNGDLGLTLLAMANPNLKWQQVQDVNMGVDAVVFKMISLRFDYYVSDTKDLLSDQTIAPSTGFASYKENVGQTRNKGLQFNLSSRIFANDASKTYVTIFGNVAHNSNKIRKVSNALKKINDQQDAVLNGTVTNLLPTSKPVTRFAEGQSTTAIWAVPSLGIDPANGKEIFIKRDGSQTYQWSAADQVVVGDMLANYNGTFGANIQYKRLSMNMAFGYRFGGQLYNSTLVDKVENADINYNVDVRLLADRWRTPGQVALYKDIADRTVTKPTSRFVQDNNEFILSSMNLQYDFTKMKFVKKMHMSGLSATLNANDLARFTTIKTERGLDYPFARTISLSLQANF